MKFRAVLPGILVFIFFLLCLHFAKKAEQGPWHQTALELWKQEDWHKLRALGENLDRVGKEDVESFYVALHAAEQMEDARAIEFFASRISDSRVLNWKMETHIASVYKPESLRKNVALFRTRGIFGIAAILLVILVLSLRRKGPYQTAPAVLSSAGILLFLL